MNTWGSPNTATPWGSPDAVVVSSWVSAYAPWLLIGGLVVLAWATNGQHGKR